MQLLRKRQNPRRKLPPLKKKPLQSRKNHSEGTFPSTSRHSSSLPRRNSLKNPHKRPMLLLHNRRATNALKKTKAVPIKAGRLLTTSSIRKDSQLKASRMTMLAISQKGTTESHMKAEEEIEETEMTDVPNTTAKTGRRDTKEMIVLRGEIAVNPVGESTTDHPKKAMKDNSGVMNVEEIEISVIIESRRGMAEKDVLMREGEIKGTNPTSKGTPKTISLRSNSSTEIAKGTRGTRGTKDPAEIPRTVTPLRLLNLILTSKSGSLKRRTSSLSSLPPGEVPLTPNQLLVPRSSKFKASTHLVIKGVLVQAAEAVAVNDAIHSVGQCS